MDDPFPRRLMLVILALVVLGGGLRLWGWIAFPALDSYDRAPLVGAGLGGVTMLAVGVAITMRKTAGVRFVGAMIGIVVGVSLGFGLFTVANGLLDQAPTRWLTYTVAGHWRGRRSIVTLTRVGNDGPPTLWLPEDRSTVGAAVGTSVTVPVRPGALHVAWRPGPISLGTAADRKPATD